MAETNPVDRPFHVRIKDNKTASGFHSGHATMTGAETAAKEANQRAVDLEIKTRYEAVPNSSQS
jgi:hypothetical protein